MHEQLRWQLAGSGATLTAEVPGDVAFIASERSHAYQVVIIDDHEMFSAWPMIPLRDRGIEAHRVPVAGIAEFAARPRGKRPGVVVLDLNLGVASDGRRIKGYDWVAQRCERATKLLNELSGREREVLEAIAREQHAADIAKKSVVSLTTVRTQVRSILRKLDVTPRSGRLPFCGSTPTTCKAGQLSARR